MRRARLLCQDQVRQLLRLPEIDAFFPARSVDHNEFELARPNCILAGSHANDAIPVHQLFVEAFDFGRSEGCVEDQ